jgi:hypothetical protein
MTSVIRARAYGTHVPESTSEWIVYFLALCSASFHYGPAYGEGRDQEAQKGTPERPCGRAAFASIIVQRRRKLKLKQRQVAERSGYSEKYIGMLERRKHTPSLTAAVIFLVRSNMIIRGH